MLQNSRKLGCGGLVLRMVLAACCWLFFAEPLVQAQPASAPKRFSAFSQSVRLNPFPPLPSQVSFAPRDFGQVERVRVLLQLDEVFYAVPLTVQESSQAYRGVFPTPRHSLSYQFQVFLRDGWSALTQRFVVEPKCEGKNFNLPEDEASLVREAMLAQLQERQAAYIADSLQRLAPEETP